MTDDECSRFAFSSESVVSQNESVVDRWLKERVDGPQPWSQRLALLRAGLRERLHVLKMTLLRRLFALAGRRIGLVVARAPMRCAAGSAASLSGLLLGLWAMLFPATVEQPTPPSDPGALTSTAALEIAPEVAERPTATVDAPTNRTLPPLPFAEEPTARLASGRPSPFYADPDLDHADYESDDPHGDRVAPVSFPTTAGQRPAVWLEGRIEDVPTADPSPGFPQRPIPAVTPVPQRPFDSGPALVIQPR